MLFLHATDAYILQSLHRKKQATNNMPYCRYQDNEMLESINHFAIFFFCLLAAFIAVILLVSMARFQKYFKLECSLVKDLNFQSL